MADFATHGKTVTPPQTFTTRCASPTSRTRVMMGVGETRPRRRRGQVGGRRSVDGFPDIGRCLENDILRRVSGPGERSGRRRSPRTRPGVSPDPSGGYAGASHSRSDRRTTDRVPNGRPRGAPRPQSAVAKRARSNAIGIRSPSRPVSRATPARPPGARRSVVQGTAAGIRRESRLRVDPSHGPRLFDPLGGRRSVVQGTAAGIDEALVKRSGQQ